MLKMNSTDAVFFSWLYIISHKSDPHLHVAHRSCIFYGKLTFSCFSIPISSNLQSLINRKEEQAGGKQSSAESLRMMMPSRREAHSSLFLHHLPAIQHEPATLGSLEACIMTTCSRAAGRERSERGGQVESERQEIINARRPEPWICPSVTMPTSPDIHHVAKASQTGIWISINICPPFPIHRLYFIKIDLAQN